jgi:hypothetical protein
VTLDHLACLACGTPLSTDALDNDGCTVEACNAEIDDDARAQLEMARAVENAMQMRSAPPETTTSDRMTSHEAAGFYRFPSVKALWMATQRHPGKYPHERRGRRILYIRPRPK